MRRSIRDSRGQASVELLVARAADRARDVRRAGRSLSPATPGGRSPKWHARRRVSATWPISAATIGRVRSGGGRSRMRCLRPRRRLRAGCAPPRPAKSIVSARVPLVAPFRAALGQAAGPRVSVELSDGAMSERGQSTVETVLMTPIVILCCLLGLQGLVAGANFVAAGNAAHAGALAGQLGHSPGKAARAAVPGWSTSSGRVSRLAGSR